MTRVALLALILAGCANSSINQSCILFCKSVNNTITQEKPK